MNPYDGEVILIMDNCAIHHVDKILEELHSTGILVIFLPPYSPDVHPIKLTFSYIKTYLQEHEHIIQHNLTTSQRIIVRNG